MSLPVGLEVRYCEASGRDRRAQIVRVVSDAIADVAIYDAAGCLEYGVTEAMLATAPEQRIVAGHFWPAQ